MSSRRRAFCQKVIKLFRVFFLVKNIKRQVWYLNPKNRISLSKGWQLITTATNKDISNGYFGAVFMEPEHHRIVVAHRGTDVTNVGSVITDLTGIVFNNCVGQLESACTLVEKVTDTLRQVEEQSKGETQFELIITGHSLGAFLTQVTAFSNEYLRIDDGEFVRNTDVARKIYHAQTYAFDSPGVRPMLLKMKQKYETDDYPIDLERLHLVSFLSAPNQINSCNSHHGLVYRTFIDTSKMTLLDRNVGYTLKTHSIDAIAASFEKGDGGVEEVMRWPVREGLAGFQELDKFLKFADYRNRYHIGRQLWDKLKSLQIKYQTRVVEKPCCPLNTFDKLERHLIEFIHWFSLTADRQAVMHEIFSRFEEDNLTIGGVEEDLQCFKIVKQMLVFDDETSKRKFITLVKSLLKTFPKISAKLHELLSDDTIRGKVFQLETKYFLAELNDIVVYKPSIVSIDEIFKKQLVHIKVNQGISRSALSAVYNNFESSKYRKDYTESGILVLDLRRLLIVNEMIDMRDFLPKQQQVKYIVFILFEGPTSDSSSSIIDKGNVRFIKDFLQLVKLNKNLNVVVVGDDDNASFDVFRAEAERILKNKGLATIEKSLSWCDIEESSQKRIFDTKLIFQGQTEQLSNLLPPQDVVCDNEILGELLSTHVLDLNVDPLSASNRSVYETVYDKKEVDIKVIMESLEVGNNVFYVSGIYSERYDDGLSALKDILKPAKEKEKIIAENLIIDSTTFGECEKKLHVFTLPGNENSLADFDTKCRTTSTRQINLHWVKVKDNKLTLRKSFHVEKYVDRALMINEANIDIRNLLAQEKVKLIAILGEKGEGKSAYLTGLARSLINSHWILFLNCYDLAFADIKSDKFDLKTFRSILRRGEDVKLFDFIFRLNLEKSSKRPIVLFLDAFEKVKNEKRRSLILKLIKFVQQSTACKVMLTTNATSLQLLNELTPTIVKFKKLTREERENIIRADWRSHFSLIWGLKKTSESLDGEKSKFKSYVTFLLDRVDKAIDEKSPTVMGAPKQLSLLAEGFREDFEKYVNMNRLTRMIFESFAFKVFYKQYIDTKYDLYISARAKKDELDQKGKNFIQSFYDVPQEIKGLLDGKSEIISSDYIWLQMTKGQNSAQILSTLVGFVLTDPKCAQVRTFLNGHVDYLPQVSTIEISEEVAKAILVKPLITTSKEGQLHLVTFLIDVLKTNRDSSANDVVLGVDEMGKTALSVAVENKRGDCLKVLLKFLIDFGDFDVLKKQMEKIGIGKVRNKFADDVDILTLTEAFLDE